MTSFRIVGLVAVVAAVALAISWQSPASSSSSATAPGKRPPRHQQRPAFGLAGGAIPDGTTVFDRQVPGVARLDAALQRALRGAASDSGVTFVVDSGWRSAAYQRRLLDAAIAQYGSKAEAARWVATPKTSAHVSGDAVDLGSDASSWLSQHGSGYGLCQIYANEPWHYELRPDAARRGCPAMYADPTHDPRMSR